MTSLIYNRHFIRICHSLRKRVLCHFSNEVMIKPQYDDDPDSVSDLLYSLLISDVPCMISRFGSVELGCLVNYLGVRQSSKGIFRYVLGRGQPWWWEERVIHEMYNNAGFFSPQADKLQRFSELMLDDIPLIDVLASWLDEEACFQEELVKASKVRFLLLDPFWSAKPWTRALAGKKVLVIHPFVETMEKQYQKRMILFHGKEILPDFDLRTIKAVQCVGGQNDQGFSDWFAALEYMKSEIDKVDYDICIIGCGAYGLPLAAYVKRAGKKAIHMGGSLQLLFGIKGRRWEDENYNDTYNYAQLMTEHWVRPDRKEVPKSAMNVEGGCYW